MRHSKYWDDFKPRIDETIKAIQNGSTHKIRRVACFITDKCNFSCKYCNHNLSPKTMSKTTFLQMFDRYGKDAIIHITGGEPSVIPWLYPLIKSIGKDYRINLNTNAYKMPPAKSIQRLKVSLDSCDPTYWNELVGKKDAFDKVVANIKKSIPDTDLSITYTLTKQNYKDAIKFALFCNREFEGIYALFFSTYKGTDQRFVMSDENANDFFNNVMPGLLCAITEESAHLLRETIDEKRRIMQGIRFEQNCTNGICYLSLSEKVIDPDGNEYTCSHLYRDGVYMETPKKHLKCRYGCNRKLVAFNQEVEKEISK